MNARQATASLALRQEFRGGRASSPAILRNRNRNVSGQESGGRGRPPSQGIVAFSGRDATAARVGRRRTDGDGLRHPRKQGEPARRVALHVQGPAGPGAPPQRRRLSLPVALAGRLLRPDPRADARLALPLLHQLRPPDAAALVGARQLRLRLLRGRALPHRARRDLQLRRSGRCR